MITSILLHTNACQCLSVYVAWVCSSLKKQMDLQKFFNSTQTALHWSIFCVHFLGLLVHYLLDNYLFFNFLGLQDFRFQAYCWLTGRRPGRRIGIWSSSAEDFFLHLSLPGHPKLSLVLQYILSLVAFCEMSLARVDVSGHDHDK